MAQDTVPASAWGPVVTFGQGYQAAAPAFLLAADGTGRAVWAADGTYNGEAGVFQSMAWWELGGEPAAEPVILALPATIAQDHRLMAMSDGKWQLFWRDSAWDAVEAEPRLWSALFTAEGVLELGPFQLSDAYVGRFTVRRDALGTLDVVWSGEPLAEPALFIREVDPAGRPRAAERLLDGGDWPVWVETSDGPWLYWLMPQSNRVQRLAFSGAASDQVETLGASPSLAPGDRLDNFTVAADATHVYALWNLTRMDGSQETWLTTAPQAAVLWPDPHRLGLVVDDGTPYVTGYNGGVASLAAAGDLWVQWAAPLASRTESMMAAVQQGDSLGIVYFRGGAIAGYQAVVPLSQALMGAPALFTDRDRHLTLVWSEPSGAGAANFKLTTTRPQ